MDDIDKKFFESLGVDFTSDFGRYNFFACTEGIMIANILQTEDKIREFMKMDGSEQSRLVPGLSDEHSGGTFNLACNAAVRYIPRLLVNMRDKKIDDILE